MSGHYLFSRIEQGSPEDLRTTSYQGLPPAPPGESFAGCRDLYEKALAEVRQSFYQGPPHTALENPCREVAPRGGPMVEGGPGEIHYLCEDGTEVTVRVKAWQAVSAERLSADARAVLKAAQAAAGLKAASAGHAPEDRTLDVPVQSGHLPPATSEPGPGGLEVPIGNLLATLRHDRAHVGPLAQAAWDAAQISFNDRPPVGRDQALKNLGWLLRNGMPPDRVDAARIARLGDGVS